MAVEVEQSRCPVAQALQRRHYPERDGAVPAEHQGNVAARQQRAEPVRQLLHRHRRLAGVLGQRVIPIRAPCLVRQVSIVMHLEPGGGELAEQEAERNAAGARSWPAA